MFTPWIVAFAWVKEKIKLPSKWGAIRPSFNFITLHYTYLISMTMLGSVILYGGNNMAYVDALFFASGSSTQSGLNTIDVNKLQKYQQVVIMLLTCMCTPIFINTFIVFIRLYWFEKRFQNVVVEARNMRRQRTKSRTKSEEKPDTGRDIGNEENGVGDREIVVLRETNGHAKGQKIDDEAMFEEGKMEMESGSASNSSQHGHVQPEEAPLEKLNTEQVLQRGITFADEVASPLERLPQRNKDLSIAFVENQRNPKDAATFRIPGPRDYDLGFVPEKIDEGEELTGQASHDANDLQVRRHRSGSLSMPPVEENSDDHTLKNHITIDVPDRRGRPATGPSAYHLRRRGSDAESINPPNHLRQRTRSRTLASFLSREKEEEDPMPYLSWTPTVGRNSAFVDLTEEQREELGGIEYRALKLLLIILVCYYVGFHLMGMVILLPWIVSSARYSQVVTNIGESPVWWGFFTPASMFNDLGFTLTPDSMISFQRAILPLLVGTFLIVIGNTGFPCMLRFVIWLLSKVVPYRGGVWEELRFLLDHPRRCFTLLFPSDTNWWLFWVLIILNGIDLIFFVILDLHDETVSKLPGGFKFLDGLFQAASTRTAGFAVVDLSMLHPAIQVSYLIMMYISVFPIAISLRKTNVYEEKSLGIYSSDDEGGGSSYIGTHFRRQLSFDLWFVFLGFFFISIIEGSRLGNTKDAYFTLFSVLFEIVSAYGTVGLSLGYPGTSTSFSAQLKPLSKLIIIAMQVRGRHRGLPYALDRAILLPSESLHKKEEEDATRRARRNSMGVEGLGPVPGVDGNTNLTRTGTARSGNSTLSNGEGFRGKFKMRHVGRFMSGALSAGPTIPREKRA
ncbi:hypothetical protein CC80DRAFT_424490 [Byssothecium circinans]|uniref:Potassium transport protein n=1 Tax=Byssothecium circinans TaxID=147558 RepID=A0A6A5TFP2_9PLEO|nr:hypothetical protein CC80DRAFT_424490 [Byssothecium circinans]